MIGMTPKQAKLYSFIKVYIASNGFPPSFREMADALGIVAKSGIHAHLNRLEGRGLIRRDPKLKRSVEIVDQPSSILEFLPPDTRRIVEEFAIAEGEAPHVIIAQWVGERAGYEAEAKQRAKSFRTPYVEQLSA